MSAPSIAVLVAVTILYGLLFHAFMRVSSILLGPPQGGIAYVALSAVFAAAISTAIWIWRARSVRPVEAWSVGGLAIAIILANLLISRGPDGLVAALTARPLHSLLTYVIVFIAVPVCVHVQLRLRRRSATRIPGDAR